MEFIIAANLVFGSFCFQMSDFEPPTDCYLSCECADKSCVDYFLRVDHVIGQSFVIRRPGTHPVKTQVDGINQELIYHLNDQGQDLRVRRELTTQKIKAVRYRTAKSEIYCSNP